MTHLQTGRDTPPPSGHTRFILLVGILHSHHDQMIQHPIPLQLQAPLITLKMSSLDGSPPQKVLIIEVTHKVVDITSSLTIQMINDGGILGIRGDNFGTRMGIMSLVGMRDGHVMDVVGVLGDSRHDDG